MPRKRRSQTCLEPCQNPESRIENPKYMVLISSINLILANGFLFNYFTLFLIGLFEPIPDRLILYFLKFENIDPYLFNSISDIQMNFPPIEKFLYFLMAFFSFSSTSQIIVAIYLIYKKIINPLKCLLLLISGLTGCLFFGFTTFMPLML